MQGRGKSGSCCSCGSRVELLPSQIAAAPVAATVALQPSGRIAQHYKGATIQTMWLRRTVPSRALLSRRTMMMQAELLMMSVAWTWAAAGGGVRP